MQLTWLSLVTKSLCLKRFMSEAECSAYGIPEFRLPKAIVQNEVNYIQKLGVDLRLGNLVGRIHTIPELMKKRLRRSLHRKRCRFAPVHRLPGENLGGIYSANEFLIRVNLMKAYQFPRIRHSNTHRQTRRRHRRRKRSHGLRKKLHALGADVCLLYRRSRDELPARHEEIENAEEEGLVCKFLAAPLEFYGDEKGWVKSMKCIAWN